MDIPELPPLHDDEYEELKESKLGVFIKFRELGFDWASRLVHYMLGFQLDIKKKYELWSVVGPEPEMLGVHVEAGPSTKEIIAAFERCEVWSRDVRKRLAYLAIFTGYIEGRKYSTPTRVSLARLVMELERFENYPWGRVVFKVLMDFVKGIDISGCYIINGFAQAFQVWVYTALPELGANYGNPLPNNPSPPILAYKGRKGLRQFKEAILSQDTYIRGESPAVHSISYHTCWTLHTALKKALHDDKYEDLKESKLGVFIKFQELGFDWASRLVHYMLGFQLDIKKKYELLSLVGPEPELTSFGEMLGVHVEAGPSTQEIIAAFERCEGWSPDDRKRLADGARAFENYPWGRVAFKVLMDSVKGRDISGCYTINGFAQALQVWEYTALPELGANYGNPLPNNPSPPILAYKGCKGRRQFKEAILSQLDIKKKYELWSLVSPEPVRFSLLEFENLTGLNCEYIEDLERPHCVVTKELTSFWEMLGVHVKAGPSTQEIIAAFERCEGWSRDDRKRLAYLAIFTGYIEGRKYSTPTRVSLARLVMELERFENYPWGESRLRC
ncbi:hypothetical protein F2Q69_00046444 [Brassica cretica]|uniref:DUF1985 domain-containing protein n=1 Tax=Brassica cretica TaxID=69181 RepID=A0A8S9PF05_BRACR|nr:hypothetical protein F2Q69_00046444 [Brassica cretica]